MAALAAGHPLAARPASTVTEPAAFGSAWASPSDADAVGRDYWTAAASVEPARHERASGPPPGIHVLRRR